MASLSALLPANEAARLAALGHYQHLSTLGEPLVEELVALTAKLFAAPVALVSLVEAATVRFVGNIGLPGTEQIDRQQSLCAVAILHEETTVFENLVDEPCDLVDPFVSRANNLLFYAGHALRTPEGYGIGSLCIMDHVARTFSPAERTLLASLTEAVQQVLTLRTALANDPQLAATLWAGIAARITPSLTRIHTLLELSAWEETPETVAAQAYRTSYHEEATLIVQALNDELRTALLRVS